MSGQVIIISLLKVTSVLHPGWQLVFCYLGPMCVRAVGFFTTGIQSYPYLLHGGGGPQVGEVTRLAGVTRLSIQSLILTWSRLHDRWGDSPQVTSPIWSPPPPCKQALTTCLKYPFKISHYEVNYTVGCISFVKRIHCWGKLVYVTYHSCSDFFFQVINEFKNQKKTHVYFVLSDRCQLSDTAFISICALP